MKIACCLKSAELKRQIIIFEGAVFTVIREIRFAGGSAGVFRNLEAMRIWHGLMGNCGFFRQILRLGIQRHCPSRRSVPEASLGSIVCRGIKTAALLIGGIAAVISLRGLLLKAAVVRSLRTVCRLLLIGRSLLVAALRVGILILILEAALLRIARGRIRGSVSGRLLREQMKLGNMNFSGISFYPLLVVIGSGLDFSFHVNLAALSHVVPGDFSSAAPEYQTMPLGLLLQIAVLIPVALIGGQAHSGNAG